MRDPALAVRSVSAPLPRAENEAVAAETAAAAAAEAECRTAEHALHAQKTTDAAQHQRIGSEVRRAALRLLTRRLTQRTLSLFQQARQEGAAPPPSGDAPGDAREAPPQLAAREASKSGH